MKKNCGLSGIHANQIQDTHFHSSWSMVRIVPFNIHGLMSSLGFATQCHVMVVFCVNCVLFAARHCFTLGQLVTSPMTNFTQAKVTLKEHNKQSSHKSASMAVVDFLNHMEKGALSVAQQIQSQGSALVQQN